MSIQQSTKRKLVLEPSQPTAGDGLQIAPVEQLLSLWCWAACIEMATTFKGNGKQQCQTANDLFSRNDCCQPPTTPPNPQCNVGASCLDVVTLCRYYYGYPETTAITSSLSIAEIANQIHGSHPIYASIERLPSPRHMVLIKGWEIEQIGEEAIEWVYYNDPDDGSSNMSRLTILQNGPMGTWNQSVINM